jgi:5-formyltetrahydrofolate cyclo-ligase
VSDNFIIYLDPLDVILMPGVAFTNNGDRLGHGMGYYDKYLQSYFNRFPNSNQHQTVLIGLAFREQIIDNVPTDENDWKLDIVLCA